MGIGRWLRGVVVASLVAAALAGCDITPIVVSGTVSAWPSGAGVGGALVQVYADDDETLLAEATSGVDGHWSLRASMLGDGTYRVRIADRWWPDGATWDEAEPLALSSTSVTILDRSVDEVGSLVGRVVDEVGVAVPDVVVAVVRASDGQAVGAVPTGVDGRFTVPVVASDTYRLAVFDPTGTWPPVFLGAETPTGVPVTSGEVTVGAIDVSTGMPTIALGTTARVSVSSDGTAANNHVQHPAISGDGRFVAFQTMANNLVGDDNNGLFDVFVHDRSTGVTSRVSVASDGTQSRGSSVFPAISADGRFVTFQSVATNLVADDTNGVTDVFVHDRSTGVTSRMSVASDGTQANADAFDPAMSADGRYISFWSRASNLVAGDIEGQLDVFVHDRVTGATSRVSIASDGTPANGEATYSALSEDGRYVAFQSGATNLVAGDTNGELDVFVHDRSTGVTSRVSVASDGTQGDAYAGAPAISADGRFVAFRSGASSLAPGDTNGVSDVFVHDRSTGVTSRVSVGSDGAQGDAESVDAGISATGRYVTFASAASTLVAGDTNGEQDVFVHDRSTGATRRLSVASDGTQSNDWSGMSVISADGRSIAFSSNATNLVPSDGNARGDTFVHQHPDD